jgi:hypothetical protein
MNSKILTHFVSIYVKSGFLAFLGHALPFGALVGGIPIVMGWLTSVITGSTKGWSAIVFVGFLVVVTLPLLPTYFAVTLLALERVMMGLGLYRLAGLSNYALRYQFIKKLNITAPKT